MLNELNEHSLQVLSAEKDRSSANASTIISNHSFRFKTMF